MYRQALHPQHDLAALLHDMRQLVREKSLTWHSRGRIL
jgi:hypothetical protein